jgi:sulfite reductase (NADPH) flavoprotein alpha-component
VSIHDVASYKQRHLKDAQDLLVIASTHGEGDPPQSAVDFFEFLEGRKAPRLPDLRFAVLALGDSTYEKYCEAGKRLDRRFEELGATRLLPRVDCDVDYDEPAAAWLDKAIDALASEGVTRQSAAIAPQQHLKGENAPDKARPYSARVIDNLILTGRGSGKETRHIELTIPDSGLSYVPGDALGVIAPNDPQLVAALLKEFVVEHDASLKIKEKRTTIGEALSHALEITAATPRFLEHWAMLSDAEELKVLLKPGQEAERATYLRSHHIIDIVRAFPVRALAPETLVAALRPMQPRLYSIASSLAFVPDEVHLTVATVRYELHGMARAGVASGYMASSAEPDSELPVYVQANPHFRLPADDVPMIMIGAGTGVAPYRAFIQEREARGAGGKSWLFFGERNFRSDFLYQTEWQQALKDGVLARMDVAFSRDQAEKLYVQNRILEQGRDIFSWLGEGAHLYVCGDATHMAPDVHRALKDVLAVHGGMSEESAEEYLRELQREHRYQRDVY